MSCRRPLKGLVVGLARLCIVEAKTLWRRASREEDEMGKTKRDPSYIAGGGEIERSI